MLFHFFRYLTYSARDFCQKVYEETILFQLKFQKSISRCSILQKIKMSNFVILKWRPFEHKYLIYSLNIRYLSVFGAAFSEIRKCWQFQFKWIKYFGNDFSFLIKWHMWIYYCGSIITGCRTWKQNWKQTWFQIGIYSRKNCPRNGSGHLPPGNSWKVRWRRSDVFNVIF